MITLVLICTIGAYSCCTLGAFIGLVYSCPHRLTHQKINKFIDQAVAWPKLAIDVYKDLP